MSAGLLCKRTQILMYVCMYVLTLLGLSHFIVISYHLTSFIHAIFNWILFYKC